MKKLLTIAALLVGVAAYLHYVQGWGARRFVKETIGRFRSAESATTTPVGSRGAGTHWETAAPMKKARSEIGAAEVGGKIYVVGGLDGFGRTLDTVEVYDIEKDSWSEAARLPQALHHPAAATDGKKVYVVGGFIGIAFRPVDTVYVYEPETDSWSEAGRLNDFRGAGAAVFVDGKLHAAGGVTPSGVSGAFEWYDGEGRVWNGLKDLPTPREHLAAVGLDEKFYAVGGRKRWVDQNLAALEAFDVSAPGWKSLPPMPTKRGGIAAAPYGGKIYVFGGEGRDGTFPQVEAYDPEAAKWELLPQPLPTPRHGLAAVPYQNRIYVLGGGKRPGFSVSDANEVLIFETPKP